MADLILIAVLAVFALWGMRKGFISTLLGFASTIISFVLTSVLYKLVALVLYESPLGEIARSVVEKSLAENVKGGELLAKTAATTSGAMLIINAISFILIIILVKVLVSLLVSVGKIASKLPLIKQANSLLGGAIGLISGAFITYIVIGVLIALGDSGTWTIASESIRESSLASFFASGNLVREIVSSVL